jgi:hypothetical protein
MIPLIQRAKLLLRHTYRRRRRNDFRKSDAFLSKRLSPFIGRARNEDCYGEPLLFSKEREDCSIQVGCNLELLPINQPFLPGCKLPAVVLILDFSVQLAGEPLAQNWCGWHKEGKITLRVHKIPGLILNNHAEWVQAVYISIPDEIRNPRLSFG